MQAPRQAAGLEVVGLFHGRAEENTALLRHALEIAVDHDLSSAALRAYVNLAESLHRRDRYGESLEKYQEGIALFKMGLDPGLDIACARARSPQASRGGRSAARVRLAVHDGERDLAESMFKSAAGMFRELGMPLWGATTLAEQAEWLRHEGQAQQAAQIGEEAAAIFERLEAKPWLRRVTEVTPPPVQVSSEPIG